MASQQPINETLLAKPIKTVEDYRQFVHYVVKELEVNYHPDNDFTEYVNKYENDSRTFTNERAAQLNARNKEAFKLFEKEPDKIYRVAYQVFRKLHP